MESSNHGHSHHTHGHNVYGNVHHRGHARTPVSGHGPGLLHLDITAANDRPAV